MFGNHVDGVFGDLDAVLQGSVADGDGRLHLDDGAIWADLFMGQEDDLYRRP
jgi:hypothetical protein